MTLAVNLTLPERQKNDRLDDAKLQHWVKWAQQGLCCQVEHEEGIKSQTYRNVVHNCYVQISTGGSVE